MFSKECPAADALGLALILWCGLNLSNRATVANRSDDRNVHDFSPATDRTLPP
jgi:hypothetical protein